MHLRISATDRLIVPDYERPDALCVPYWDFDIVSTLQSVVRAAVRHTGIVLIGPDPEAASEFAATTAAPDHIAFVAGSFDSPWLRDYAPIAVEKNDAMLQVLPRHHIEERPVDTELFSTILATAFERTEALLPAGNLVAGPAGLAVSTTAALDQNGYDDARRMIGDARRLGIRDWLFVDPFPDDISRHSDAMVRFLSPTLCAVAMRTDPQGGPVSERLIADLSSVSSGLEVLALEVRPMDGVFSSALNWIQLGRHLLVPEFTTAPGLDDSARRALVTRGFELTFVPAQTHGLGGALRCLTAAIFATPRET